MTPSRWTERQQALLRQIGVRLWWPPALPDRSVDAAASVESGDCVEPIDLLESARSGDGSTATAPVAAATATAPTVVTVPPPGSIDAMDWVSLRAAVAACTACALHRDRRQTVFGSGHVGAHWMIVGEAPGEQDDGEGEPFVGKPGQLLDNMLRAVGLTRGDGPPARQVYVALTVKCRPADNRNPEPAELAQCEAFLQRQVQLVQPRIVLAMGRFAAQSLLQSSEPLGRLRGRVHVYRGVPLVATFHPAYLLRNPADKAGAWDDLCLALEAVRAVDSPPPRAAPAAAARAVGRTAAVNPAS